MTRALTVLAAGPLTTVQDAGRVGQGALGIGPSGACDRTSYRLANRLVGNDEGAAALELTFGGLRVRAHDDMFVVTTGAPCAGSLPHNAPTALGAGETLQLGAPRTGLRTYLAVRGGITVDAVLGSRSTDVLAGIGPPVVSNGMVLPVGDPPDSPVSPIDAAPVPDPEGGAVTVRVMPGPRRNWLADDAWGLLVSRAYTVSTESNRVGLRLDGEPLERARTQELASEGMVRGAVQVPPSGQPVLFVADHPVTGGYPVAAYVVDVDVDLCAQLRPGQKLHFRDA